jgi:hypothetical protein
MKIQNQQRFYEISFDIRRTVADVTLDDQQKLDALMNLAHKLMGTVEDVMFKK